MKVLINSDVFLHWNYSLGGDIFREARFIRTGNGADQTIGLIVKGDSGNIAIIDEDVKTIPWRFAVREPATLVIRNVTTDDLANYLLIVQSLTGTKFQDAESSVYLDVLGKSALLLFFYFYFCVCTLCSTFEYSNGRWMCALFKSPRELKPKAAV